ncbi:MAG TPA: formate dehydrogenase accessory protein FdhE, partial [Longimicrobiales bacterium]
LERERPELAPWLRPLRLALASLQAAPWTALAPVLAAGRDPGAPLLEGATVPLPPRACHALVHAVLAEALGAPGSALAGRVDAARLLCAAVACDDEQLAALALDVHPAALNAAAQLAALPLLHGARAPLSSAMPASWGEPHCPLCGALPALVEVRGLERARTLRCGRCGAAWTTHVLLCAFCGERDHERLGALVPEGAQGQLRWLETCASCRSYLKVFATLRGAAPEALPLLDARSIELDMVALGRGFARPERWGRPARLRVVPAAAGVA